MAWLGQKRKRKPHKVLLVTLQEVTQGKFLCEVPSFVGQNSHPTQSQTQLSLHTNTHRDMCIHTETHVHTQTHAQAHTQTCTHTHTHTHTPFWVELPGVWRRKWQPTPVFLPGKVHGQRSLAGCSPEHVCTRVEGDGLIAIKW